MPSWSWRKASGKITTRSSGWIRVPPRMRSRKPTGNEHCYITQVLHSTNISHNYIAACHWLSNNAFIGSLAQQMFFYSLQTGTVALVPRCRKKRRRSSRRWVKLSACSRTQRRSLAMTVVKIWRMTAWTWEVRTWANGVLGVSGVAIGRHFDWKFFFMLICIFFTPDFDANNIFKAFFGGPGGFSFEGRLCCMLCVFVLRIHFACFSF